MADRDDAIEAGAKAWYEQLHGGMVGSLLDPRDLAQFVVKALTALGAVMPGEAAKLRADLKRATSRERIASQHAHRCDADVAESDAEAKRLGAQLATIEAVHARHRAIWYEERDGLKDAITDALLLCREIRPDSVLGTSPAARLKLIEDRLALATRQADGHD